MSHKTMVFKIYLFFKLRLGASIPRSVGLSVGRSSKKIAMNFPDLSSKQKQNTAKNLSWLSSKHNWLHVSMKCLQKRMTWRAIEAKLTLTLSSNQRPKYPIEYNSTHQPSLHAQLEAIERKLALRSNQRPKHKSTVAHTDPHFMNS